MRELEKIRNVLQRKIPGAPHEVLLVLDATNGQNAIRQAEVFTKSIGCTGVILTKLDGTAKGGVVVAVRQTINLPVKFIGVGEAIDDLQPFDADTFVESLFVVMGEVSPKSRLRHGSRRFASIRRPKLPGDRRFGSDPSHLESIGRPREPVQTAFSRVRSGSHVSPPSRDVMAEAVRDARVTVRRRSRRPSHGRSDRALRHLDADRRPRWLVRGTLDLSVATQVHPSNPAANPPGDRYANAARCCADASPIRAEGDRRVTTAIALDQLASSAEPLVRHRSSRRDPRAAYGSTTATGSSSSVRG